MGSWTAGSLGFEAATFLLLDDLLYLLSYNRLMIRETERGWMTECSAHSALHQLQRNGFSHFVF